MVFATVVALYRYAAKLALFSRRCSFYVDNFSLLAKIVFFSWLFKVHFSP